MAVAYIYYISFVSSQYRVRIECGWLIFLLFWPGVGLFNISKNKDVVGTSRI